MTIIGESLDPECLQTSENRNVWKIRALDVKFLDGKFCHVVRDLPYRYVTVVFRTVYRYRTAYLPC